MECIVNNSAQLAGISYDSTYHGITHTSLVIANTSAELTHTSLLIANTSAALTHTSLLTANTLHSKCNTLITHANTSTGIPISTTDLVSIGIS